MSEQDYFKNALSDFTFEVASGGAIRHLADLGYTVSQITERLTFPTAFERVQKTVWRHFLDTGILRLEEPGSGEKQERFDYVREYDQYGKASFRRVSVEVGELKDPVLWRERSFQPEGEGAFADFLVGKCRENGQENAYVSCDFRAKIKKEQTSPGMLNQILNKQQWEYLQGLPWPESIVYHRLNNQMQNILIRLYENADYCGTCYFLRTREKLYLDGRDKRGL